jgi:hypothetical protein
VSDRDAGELQRAPAPLRFVGGLRAAWNLYRKHFHVASGLFFGVFLLWAYLPGIFYADIPAGPAYALWVFVRHVVPMCLGALAAAALTLIVRSENEEVPIGVRTALARLDDLRRDVVVGGLFAALMTLLFSTFILPDALGEMIGAAFFLGPPILVQVIAVERMQLVEAWARTRLLLRGNWGRIVLYIFNLALALSFFVLISVRSLAVTADGGSTAVRFLALGFLQALMFGVGTAFIVIFVAVMYADLAAHYEKVS